MFLCQLVTGNIVLPFFRWHRTDPDGIDLLDFFVMGFHENRTILTGNHAAAIVYGPLQQGISRIEVVLRFQVDDKLNHLSITGSYGMEPDIIINRSFRSGFVFCLLALDARRNSFRFHRNAADARFALDLALRNILQITILEFFCAGLQDMGHNAPLRKNLLARLVIRFLLRFGLLCRIGHDVTPPDSLLLYNNRSRSATERLMIPSYTTKQGQREILIIF